MRFRVWDVGLSVFDIGFRDRGLVFCCGVALGGSYRAATRHQAHRAV